MKNSLYGLFACMTIHCFIHSLVVLLSFIFYVILFYLQHVFSSRSISKPLWSFEDITPRNYKIKSAEQMEIFLALVIHIFSTSDIGSSVQGDWAKVALQWATTCSSRHYAGRSFQVFRALKVPLSWPMLSDVLSRLVESVGDTSEDVQVSFSHLLTLCYF